MRKSARRGWLFLVLGLGAPVLIAAFLAWRVAGRRGGQQPVEPFRIAGNFHYVGTSSVSVFLITGPEGHVVLDGGYPGAGRRPVGSPCSSCPGSDRSRSTSFL